MTDDRPAGMLLAAWPGMGSVALLTAFHVIQELDGERQQAIDLRPWFPPQAIDVQDGIISAAAAPACHLYRCAGALPDASDLLVCVGESQPNSDGYGLCRAVVEQARRHGVRRFVTCAAMANAHQPGSEPGVLAAATDRDLLEQAVAAGAKVLDEGRVGGLNGLLLQAASEAGGSGLCLLGEMPFYATAIANPSASLACLQCLMEMAGIVLRLDELAARAAEVDERLMSMVQAMELQQEPQPDRSTDKEEQSSSAIDLTLRQRIEGLFAAAATNRDRALELKRLLDEHDLFDRYEDRFLDLFRRTD